VGEYVVLVVVVEVVGVWVDLGLDVEVVGE